MEVLNNDTFIYEYMDNHRHGSAIIAKILYRSSNKKKRLEKMFGKDG